MAKVIFDAARAGAEILYRHDVRETEQLCNELSVGFINNIQLLSYERPRDQSFKLLPSGSCDSTWRSDVLFKQMAYITALSSMKSLLKNYAIWDFRHFLASDWHSNARNHRTIMNHGGSPKIVPPQNFGSNIDSSYGRRTNHRTNLAAPEYEGNCRLIAMTITLSTFVTKYLLTTHILNAT